MTRQQSYPEDGVQVGHKLSVILELCVWERTVDAGQQSRQKLGLYFLVFGVGLHINSQTQSKADLKELKVHIEKELSNRSVGHSQLSLVEDAHTSIPLSVSVDMHKPD